MVDGLTPSCALSINELKDQFNRCACNCNDESLNDRNSSAAIIKIWITSSERSVSRVDHQESKSMSTVFILSLPSRIKSLLQKLNLSGVTTPQSRHYYAGKM